MLVYCLRPKSLHPNLQDQDLVCQSEMQMPPAQGDYRQKQLAKQPNNFQVQVLVSQLAPSLHQPRHLTRHISVSVTQSVASSSQTI